VNCIVITPMVISIVEACVCPVQDTRLYASGQARICSSTDAAWPKPSLREQRRSSLTWMNPVT